MQKFEGHLREKYNGGEAAAAEFIELHTTPEGIIEWWEVENEFRPYTQFSIGRWYEEYKEQRTPDIISNEGILAHIDDPLLRKWASFIIKADSKIKELQEKNNELADKVRMLEQRDKCHERFQARDMVRIMELMDACPQKS